MTSSSIQSNPVSPAAAASSQSFDTLGLSEALLSAVKRAGHHTPTAIQVSAIPLALAGRDIIGCAQTGTGKTAAFALPVLQLLSANTEIKASSAVRALILSPTRELAAQIAKTFLTYGGQSRLKHAVVYGGVGFGEQLRALRSGVDILVATPGRLEDLMRQGVVSLGKVEILVIDEADRMLDQGFFPAIQRIVQKLPVKRQTLCFTATLPAEVRPLIQRLLKSPEHLQVAALSSTPDLVEQVAYFVDMKDKSALLKHLIESEAVSRALVFTRTKRGADKVAKHLNASSIRSEAIHGNKSQNARDRALHNFKSGKVDVLVATDVAARGIQVDNISHVINYDLPIDAESYVHRIGRTARAGAQGKAFSLCTHEDQSQLVRIERLIRRTVPIAKGHPFAIDLRELPKGEDRPNPGRFARRGPPPRAHSNNAGATGQYQARKNDRRPNRPGRPNQGR